MATLCSSPFSLTQTSPYKCRPVHPKLPYAKLISRPVFSARRFIKSQATNSSSSSTSTIDESLIDVLRSFVDLNVGKWNGSFYQFDSVGNLMHRVSTKLSAGCYGENELMSLIQTLYIRQPSRYDEELEWAEYKIKETNMFTVDKYQQIGFFFKERAFALRYQTAGMLEHVLRQGVLGEDDTGEESPRNLKLPSRRPAIVCESCLYLQEKDMRARAFHVMDPKGCIEMILIFLEERDDGALVHPSLEEINNDPKRIKPHLGKWKGQSLTKRSGVYGGTIAEADTTAIIEFDDKGQLIQDISSTSRGTNVTTNVNWTGIISDNMVTFEGGYQMILLPGGMYIGCPCDISKIVEESKSFHLEFCWLESPNKRQRLIRTFDLEGLAVSTTYFSETKS